MERFEALKTSVLTHPQVGDTVIAVWESVRTALLSALADEDGPLRRRAVEALRSLGRGCSGTTSCVPGSTGTSPTPSGGWSRPTAPRSPP